MSDHAPTVEACPNCDSPKITERETKTPAFRCNVCRERFAEPTERPNKNYIYATAADAPDPARYQQLLTALQRTRDAGSSHARAKLIAQYSDVLSTAQVAEYCTRWAEPRGDVERYREASLGIIWRITIDDDASAEVPA